MDENVALDSTKQKKFAKSIKGIKKLLKKNDSEPHKPAVLAPKDGDAAVNKKKRERKERGLVYLSHIPHGFYEHQMTQYFKQFGMVTNVRVIRSPRTGRSKGFAFVEFREPAVADIVAETMNNYLMGKRLIKAVVVPPEKQKKRAFRKQWTAINNPTAERRRKIKKAYNADKDEAGDLQKAKNLYKMFQNKKKKFSALGISIDFFKPVDVPKALLENTVKQESGETKVKAEEAKKKKTKAAETVEKSVKKEKKVEPKQTKEAEVKSKKEIKKEEESNKSKQKAKEKKLKDSGVKLPENFIQIQPESADESDSSVDFDSDEYEKMLENESDGSSDDSEDGNEDGEDEDDSEDDDEVDSGEEELLPLIPIKLKKGKKQLVAPPPQPKVATKQVNIKKEKPQGQQKQDQTHQQKKPQGHNQVQKKVQSQAQKKPQPQGNKQNKPLPQIQTPPEGKAVKRKNPQPEVSPKKPKFEKQDKKHRNKQFKKKNKAN